MSSTVVIIIGRGKGLVGAIDGLVGDGAIVYVGTPAEELKDLKASKTVQTFEVNLTNYESVARVFQIAWNEYARIDTVISYLPDGSPLLSPSLPSTSFPPDSSLPIFLARLSTHFFFETKYVDPDVIEALAAGRIGNGMGTASGVVEGVPIGMEKKGKGGKSWLIIVGPEPPEANTDMSPLEAAQANGLLGFVRSLLCSAGDRYGVAMVCAPSNGAEGEVMYEAIQKASAQVVPTDPTQNCNVFVRKGDAWKVLPNGQGQTLEMENMQTFGTRLGAGLVIGGALKHLIKSQSIALKNYTSLLQPLGMLVVFLMFWYGSHGVRNWMLIAGGFLGVKALIGGGKGSGQEKVVRRDGETCSVGVFLGSGGHTGEAIQLLSALDPTRYNHRIYIHCTGDTLSITKAIAFEKSIENKSSASSSPTSATSSPSYEFIELPRARQVYQSYLSAVGTTLDAGRVAVWKLVLKPMWNGSSKRQRGKPVFDVLLVNGPGTCVVVVGAFWLARLLGQPTPRMIYVESFARVKSLSLSGKILRPFVDRFIVQWDPETGKEVQVGEAGKMTKLGETRGWLV